MALSHSEIIRHHCSPLEPVPTGVNSRLRPLAGIRAVLFDVYGTLFISASGDVGTAAGEQRAALFTDALAAVGVRLCDECLPGNSAEPAADMLIASIHAAHQSARERGIEYPEVDITAVWGETLDRLQANDMLASRPDGIDLARLALEYEVRANPTWPMPGLQQCLRSLHERALTLGIVSNAQFFTPELFSGLLGQTPEQLGFAPHLQFYSYRSGQAKPGVYLYQQAAETLRAAGISPGEVVYIGNDMLNDIVPAWRVGFRTGLFAGDARSLRLREEDLRVHDLQPDLILTRLPQILACLAP